MSRDRDRTGDEEGELSGDFASWYQSARPYEERRTHALAQLQDALHSPDVQSSSHAPASAKRGRIARSYFIAAGALAAGAFFMMVARVRLESPDSRSSSVDERPAALAGQTSTARRPVGFTLQLTDGTARHVSLAGDFNGWNTAALPMLRDASAGVWRIRITLPPGRHTYSYVIDGTRWVIDPLAPRTNDGELGPTNVITIAGDS
jgi:hypothetical protein